jgi:hypothetical protein
MVTRTLLNVTFIHTSSVLLQLLTSSPWLGRGGVWCLFRTHAIFQMSGDFIPIDILAGFLFQSSKILDFWKSNQFLLKSSPIHWLRQVSISGAICPFPFELISQAAALQCIVAHRCFCDKIYSESSYTWWQESWVTILYTMAQKFVNCPAGRASVHVS